MSNFKTFGVMSDGQLGTAPAHFIASTADNLATVTAAGYLNDKGDIVKNNDYVWVNYSDTTVLPAQITATPGLFQATYSAPNMNLVLLPQVSQIGFITSVDVIITAAALASSAHVPIIPPLAGAQYRLLNMFLNSNGTNFSGGGGNRLLAIEDGTSPYSVIPAANLQALTNAAWGSTALPFPAAVAIDEPTDIGAGLYAIYSGGTTDYAAGSLVLTVMYKRIA